ncbi:MAG TPA: hypothetical protein VF546_21185 [Pyrinomonadaceae bacterium]|jgi:hypothetical protein
MKRLRVLLLLLAVEVCATGAAAQRAHSPAPAEGEFGPVVSAYLGYLRAEQEVVDARESRREITHGYYRRNSNRIRALRQMALRIARTARNDYLPELEAVAADELNTLFETPPGPQTFRPGDVLEDTFRYLGAVREGETFYLFARLDPYEQADLIQQKERARGQTHDAAKTGGAANAETTAPPAGAASRPRRISPP